MPQLSAESLSGKDVSLPEATTGRIAVFCIGFSHNSQSEVKHWSERAQKQFADNPQIVVYSIAVLEDAPKLVRGMIVHAMKSGVPIERRDRFLILYHNEQRLKQATGFERSTDAYLLLLDQSGDIRWRYHGEPSDAAEADLSKQIRGLLEAHGIRHNVELPLTQRAVIEEGSGMVSVADSGYRVHCRDGKALLES